MCKYNKILILSEKYLHDINLKQIWNIISAELMAGNFPGATCLTKVFLVMAAGCHMEEGSESP